jgi:hypothetical protein
MSGLVRIEQTVHRVTVVQDGRQIIVTPAVAHRVTVAEAGTQGASGTGGGIEHIQSTPSANWIIAHPLGRRPGVNIYLSSGEAVEADVSASLSSVSITFPSPVSGSAVLT